MSAKTLAMIDRFYWLLAGVLLILSFLVIFTLRGIFQALNTANEVDEAVVGSPVRVDKANLDKAYESIFNKKFIPLDEGR